jgi:1,4-dihydroxy-2-naphthoyl-CoA synthase
MGVENLAVVFAPNIIKTQSEDTREIMKQSPVELKFVKFLLEASRDNKIE